MPRKLLCVFFAAVVLPAVAFAADDLQSVLARLNTASQNFRSSSADFQFVTETTEPIPNKEVQTGQVYYERAGKSFQMAAHIHQIDGQPAPKTYIFSAGKFRLWEGGNVDQVTTLSKLSQYESWFMLGFGASGKEMEEKWSITFDGMETIDGVKTAKLELVPKDPAVRKNLPKVTVWIDPSRGVSLKQVFDEGEGQTRTCTYTNIKVNQPLPADAFTIKTDSKTQYVNR